MSSIPKPRGLINLGNTCYFNSVMQVLLNAPLFGSLLVERASTSSENRYVLDDSGTGQATEIEIPECDFAVKALVELYSNYFSPIQTISNANFNPIAPTKLMSCIRQKTGRFQRLVQEDSHELLRSLLDVIRSDEIRRQKAAIESCLGEKNYENSKAASFTIIDIIFGGYFLSTVQCQRCKFISEHLEPFYDLSLAISDPIDDVRSALLNFTSNAILDGDNKFICERCSRANGKKTYEAGIKSTTIAAPPNILTLHLKRFEVNHGARNSFETKWAGLGGGRKNKRNCSTTSRGGKKKGKNNRGKSVNDEDDGDEMVSSNRCGIQFRKINKHVEFTEFIDLSEFTCQLCYDLTKVNKWPRIQPGSPIWYSLFGVVCHSGNLRGGHYTAYIKCEDPFNVSDGFEEFAQFIQESPYLPELANIEKIRSLIRQYDVTRCSSTERYREDESDFNGQNSDDDDKPKSSLGSWYHISDSDVRKSSLASVLASQAYIVFYRRMIE